jgi:SAM-dependent methyltransferase
MHIPTRHITDFLQAYCHSTWCDDFRIAQVDWLSTQLKRQFGYFSLQIGTPYSLSEAFDKCPISCKTSIAEQVSDGGQLIADWENLPIRDDAVDLVVLAHSLELIKDPYALLREVERVLIADGRVIILGFEPQNAWRGRWFGKHRVGLHQLNFYGAGRLVDWLQALGFEIEQVQFHPNTGWKRWLPWLSTPCTQGYSILARKATARVRLIGLRDGWRWQSLLPQLARRNLAQFDAKNTDL